MQDTFTGTSTVPTSGSSRNALDTAAATAEMDVLVAVSACPDDLTAMNDHACKAVAIEIFD